MQFFIYSKYNGKPKTNHNAFTCSEKCILSTVASYAHAYRRYFSGAAWTHLVNEDVFQIRDLVYRSLP